MGWKQVDDTLRRQGRKEKAEDHVIRQTLCQGAAPNDNIEELWVTSQRMETFHGEGKVNMLREKENDIFTLKRKEAMPNILPIADLEEEMIWEKSKTEEGEKKSYEETCGKDKCRDSGLKSSETGSWADDDSSPLPMFFNQEKGWVTEPLGLKSGLWKRIARKQNKPSPTKKGSPKKTKRIGPVAL